MNRLTLLTVQEAAKALRVSTETVRRLIRSGQLKAVRVAPRCLRISEDSLIAIAGGTSDAD